MAEDSVAEALRFVFHRQKGVLKWDHYFDIYERFFGPIRNDPIRVLEIGVHRGGSLRMWRDYFPNAKIIGIDIAEECKEYEEDRIAIEVGDQADQDFLASVCDRHGAPDVVIDDGSHEGADQIASFEAIFPGMPAGGIYLVEDLHYEGSRPFVQYVKDHLSDLSHEKGVGMVGVHFFRSVIVFERGELEKPTEVSR